jgi:hypothetical protein
MAKKPQFDVNVRVAKQPEAYMQYSETEGSITSVEEGLARSTHIPDLHPPPRRRTPPTVFSKVRIAIAIVPSKIQNGGEYVKPETRPAKI